MESRNQDEEKTHHINMGSRKGEQREKKQARRGLGDRA